MPSPLSHAIAGIALGPAFFSRDRLRRPCLWGAACAVLPDADLVGVPFGLIDHPILGHRALSHSLPAAAVVATVVTIGAFHRPHWNGLRARLWLYLFLATATHGFLDALSAYGAGVAFLAPFSSVRTKSPWHPISGSMLGATASWPARAARALLVEVRWIWLPALALGGAALRVRAAGRRSALRSAS